MHRLIANSATYRQSSRVPPELNGMDPYNRLLARQNRLRLDAEVGRDVAPLQALTLLNNRQFYELAQGLAARLFREGGQSDGSRIELAFRLCTSRSPKPEERRTLQKLLAQQRAVNQDVPDAPTGIDADQFAACTTIARVLLNLDETITRE